MNDRDDSDEMIAFTPDSVTVVSAQEFEHLVATLDDSDDAPGLRRAAQRPSRICNP